MLYLAYQTHADLLAPLRVMANLASPAINFFTEGLYQNTPANRIAAGLEMLSRAGLSHGRPPYGITRVTVGNQEVAVTEEAAFVTPFGTMLHFKKDIEVTQPRVLLVAPLSGHFATLLRNTVETMLPEHDVYITDWHNARDVPLKHGRFGFDDYVDHIIQFLEHLGPGAHVVAVCQPCVQVLVAATVMAETNNPAQPRSMTLMAGPIDCRINPTKVNELATGRPIEWFEKHLITAVPLQFPGAGRRVYPGFMQLTAFMSMNLSRHVRAHLDLYDHIVGGDRDKAEASKAFYDEYFAVLDLPAEFYLETVRMVFQEHLLPQGLLEYRGRKINPKAIRRTALFTVEGEKDDICAIGQTLAAHDLCTGLRPYFRKHHLQPGVGHYGVFSGRRWQNQIYPLLRNVILQFD
ncbi:polyhydroxyalkanoate depolymerase [Desertibaculum subflavum]|uniref:polyhydroxyalkanoate depolymerase n=1 Tax=Desertibaculum subflavum TaxID=2268458 RepID=UPI000E673E17